MDQKEVERVIQGALQSGFDRLHLGSIKLSTLPSSISTLTSLKVLYLSYNQLSTLPSSVSALTNLTKLYLSYNRLSTIPSSISTLTILKWLNLTDNILSTLPSSISTLTNLKELYLSNNQLSSLSSSISTLTNLNVLFLSFNRLSTLPSSISTLTNLKELYLHNNQLTTLPSSISTLTNLEVLYLNYNQISTLPSSISTLTNLNKLYLRFNPLVHPPANIAEQGIESIREWFKDQFSNKLKELNISKKKILIVGDAEVGKTSLVRRLMDGKMNWEDIQNFTRQRTAGVDVHHIITNGDNNDRYISIWDFAGQEIYFGSHRFYFTNDAFYIIVFKLYADNKDKIIQPIKKWMMSIQQQSTQSEMLLTGTYLDEINENDQESLMGYIEYRTKSNNNIIFVSNKNSTNIDQIRQEIIKSVTGEEMIPEVFLDVFEQIKKFKQNGLQWITIQQLIESKSFNVSTTLMNQILGYLQKVGELLFQSVHGNDGFIILNNDWLSKRFSSLLHDTLYCNNGWFKVSQVPFIWKEDKALPGFPESLLRIMHKVGLIYYNEKEGLILVPQRLPEKKLLDCFPNKPYSFGRIWHFDYILPLGLFEALIVQMMEFGVELGMAFTLWKNVIIIAWDGNDAVFYRNNSSGSQYINDLELITWENQSNKLVDTIWRLLNNIIDKECTNIKPNHRVACVCSTCQQLFRKGENYHHYPLNDADRDNSELLTEPSLNTIYHNKLAKTKCKRGNWVNIFQLLFEYAIPECIKTLSVTDILEYKRKELAKKIVSHYNWRNIGLYFEPEYRFKISEDDLKVKHPPGTPALQLCEDLIEELAQRNVSIRSLVEVLNNTQIGMNTVAGEVAAEFIKFH